MDDGQLAGLVGNDASNLSHHNSSEVGCLGRLQRRQGAKVRGKYTKCMEVRCTGSRSEIKSFLLNLRRTKHLVVLAQIEFNLIADRGQ